MMDSMYNNERGDGSLGQIENVSVDYPVDETTYVGQIMQYTYGGPV